ncbi:hypothetical protein SAMN05444394_4012 [Algoriphagus halophilus]|uniref:6-bladed beta-propeller protein n=2 Tax=Algoriphagus halophilus TaxID=226505 RepID=A0A1N6HUK8_9BACT|nr:hypothetical protein SAMN05444394_4012 [Algoriphagus halophilus]
MKKHFLYFLLIIAYSCQTPSNEKSDIDQPKEISIEVEDSVTVNGVLAQLFLFQTADQYHVIFKDFLNSKVYVVNKDNGKIDYEWSKSGDVPGAFGSMTKPLSISKEGNIVVVDYMAGQRVFQKNGDVTMVGKPVKNQVSFGGPVSLLSDSQVVSIDGEEYVLYSLDLLEQAEDYNSEFLQKRRNLILSNLKTDETRLIVPFPEGSKFLSGKVFPFEDFRPRFVVNEEEDRLYLIFQNEPVLYTYQWNDGNPVFSSSLAISLPGFEENEGVEIGAIGLGQVSDPENEPFPARIQGIAQAGNGFLITYSTKPSERLYSLYKAKEISKEQRDQLFQEISRKTVFMDDSGNVFPVNFPEMYYESFVMVDGKIHWMKKTDPNTEAEDFTVYWGKLKIE